MNRSFLLPLRAASRPIPAFRSRPAFVPLGRRTLVSAADLQFGQPLHETHPHIVKPGHLTPGIPALEYHQRRAALARKLPKNSIAVLASNELKFRSSAVFYEFYQEPNFYYLTGFNEPESLAVIDQKAEIWDGARSGVQAAQDVFNADEAGDINNVSNILPDIINSAREIFTDIGSYGKKSALSRFFSGSTTKVDGLAKLLQNSTVKSLRPLLNELRLTKSKAELDCMRRAGTESGKVITEAMRYTPNTEKQLWTDLSYGFRTRGLDGEAYVPVVAGGTNALSIHYVRNDQVLDTEELVLVDAGGEYGGYITDITRTWPVAGKFSPAQKGLYEMILAVQKSCVSLCREDADTTLDKLHRVAENGLRNGLKDLGFDTTRSDCLDTLFPHHVGHYIGLDVHDAPGYPRTDRLRENQCITIEPGIYVPVDDERWPEHFRGLGIRIEDSVRIGEEKVEVLTETAVKDVKDIEGLRS